MARSTAETVEEVEDADAGRVLKKSTKRLLLATSDQSVGTFNERKRGCFENQNCDFVNFSVVWSSRIDSLSLASSV